MIFDELTDESSFILLPFQEQTELIAHYCHDIKNKITGSQTMAEAQGIADEHCLQFQRSCSSEVLRNAMTEYVQELIRQTWS